MKNVNLVTSAAAKNAYSQTLCDLCPALAKYLAKFTSGELFFCRHHFLEKEEKLSLVSQKIVEINFQI